MIQGMTGFGSAENDAFRIEIRSLNHRFLDISVKMPSYLIKHEMQIRNSLKDRFRRGKLDVSVSAINSGISNLKINSDLAGKIISAFRDLQRELSIPGEMDIGTLAGYRELLVEEEKEYNVDTFYMALREAIARLEEMRVHEGNLLSDELARRTESLRKMNAAICSVFPDSVVQWRECLIGRLKSVTGNEIDSARILQEAAIIADKLDISEETSRTENHLNQISVILEHGGAVGRKLDFLLQEINREVNTIASKSADAAIAGLTVEMKSELEKMREQVQNLQ